MSDNLKPSPFMGILLRNNGWTYKGKWSATDPDDMGVYEIHIRNNTCYAVITETENQLGCMGHYGVGWVDVLSDEKPPYGRDDLRDMSEAIALAEDNLLLIGVPFVPGYEFSDDKENKGKQNSILREKYGFDKLEKEQFGEE